jgi:hypothetical protein
MDKVIAAHARISGVLMVTSPRFPVPRFLFLRGVCAFAAPGSCLNEMRDGMFPGERRHFALKRCVI